jgi:hypothetical protein
MDTPETLVTVPVHVAVNTGHSASNNLFLLSVMRTQDYCGNLCLTVTLRLTAVSYMHASLQHLDEELVVAAIRLAG